jgi:cation diffusion facilitator CzcD-associated flavoprotein CzcO
MVGKRIAVIGAVQERLAAAMLLARRGFQIQVFEKAPVIGGRNAEVVLGEYRFDLAEMAELRCLYCRITWYRSPMKSYRFFQSADGDGCRRVWLAWRSPLVWTMPDRLAGLVQRGRGAQSCFQNDP